MRNKKPPSSGESSQQASVHEAFNFSKVPPEDMDVLWAHGFRHFGTLFFRYSEISDGDAVNHVIPLRINLKKFEYSSSQNRILRKNRDLIPMFRESFIDQEKRDLFDKHKVRFKGNVPESLYTFLSPFPSKIPCDNIECCLYDKGKLVAVGFLDLGKRATSCVYTIFDTDYEKRSLGIFMILVQIQYSLAKGMTHVYHGYVYRETSAYDYKKNFYGLESYDWTSGQWQPHTREHEGKRVSKDHRN